MSELDLAWMGGILEGEGSIGIEFNRSVSKNGSHYVRVGIGNTDMALLEPFQVRWGGTIHDHGNPGQFRMWNYSVNSRLAGVLLRDLIPYLRGRKSKQAEWALYFQGSKSSLHRKDVDPGEEVAWREACRQELMQAGKGEPV